MIIERYILLGGGAVAKSGLTSSPFLTQASQVNWGSMSLRRTSYGHRSALILV
jgi:hypothetical protein